MTEVGLRLDPLHHLRVGKMAVTPKDQQSVGPRLTKPFEQAFPYREHLRAGEAFGLKDRGDQAP